MGLDQFLYKSSYVQNWDFHTDEEKHTVVVSKGGSPRLDIKPERVNRIIEKVGQWRKFNALHNWFVQVCGEGVDECQEIGVSSEKMNQLLETLKKVQEILSGYDGMPNEEMKEKVIDLFPPVSGFFFGSTDIDDWFVQDVNETIVLLEELIKEDKENTEKGLFLDYYYQASW